MFRMNRVLGAEEGAPCRKHHRRLPHDPNLFRPDNAVCRARSGSFVSESTTRVPLESATGPGWPRDRARVTIGDVPAARTIEAIEHLLDEIRGRLYARQAQRLEGRVVRAPD